MRSIARAEFASSAVKPPESRREPATGPPKTPAIRTKATTASRVRLGRAVVREVREAMRISEQQYMYNCQVIC